MGRCITDNTLAALIDGQLTAAERMRVMDHIGDCLPCRDHIAQMLPAPGEEGELTEPMERISLLNSADLAHAAQDWAPPPPATLIGQRIGALVVTRTLGAGAMGEVYEVRSEELAQVRALKVLQPHLAQDPQVQARFRNEARVMGMISHPGLVGVHSLIRLPDGAMCIEMEYLEGETLRERLRRGGALRRGTALRFGRQLAQALRATHDKNIVHRDLKPANVMIVKDPDVVGGERTKILDFGIAKLGGPMTASLAGDQVHTRSGVSMGTPAYMAPEQIGRAAEVTDRADVFALGMMLFEMLVGHLPFTAQTDIELYRNRLSRDPPRPWPSIEAK